MCLGGNQPQAPEIRYVGPSDEDIKRNEESLQRYQDQMALQAETFQTQLQAQIDQATADTADLRAEFDDQIAAAEASGADAITGATNDANAAANARTSAASASAQTQQVYALTAQSSEVENELAQTTTSIKDKKKKKPSLKISTAGVANQAGSGVNLGI